MDGAKMYTSFWGVHMSSGCERVCKQGQATSTHPLSSSMVPLVSRKRLGLCVLIYSGLTP
jgi:hypothetical protein